MKERGRPNSPAPLPSKSVAMALATTVDSIETFAREVFGSQENAEKWMTRPRACFAGQSPRQFIRSGDTVALRKVLDRLIDINYGLYS